jgi:3-hydroxyisobutyrate dehydrogenase-like beta-hydroxyacid dehydrogenase
MNIGFLGAGLMSAPMVANLVADGHAVRVWNRTAEKAAALGTVGAQPMATAAEVCEPGGVVMSCLADDAALDAVFATGDVLSALGQGGVHVSMSTISAACAARLAEAHALAGVDYVAAPVLGRPEAVQARIQSWIVAGRSEAKARVVGLLEQLGRKVFDFGEQPAAANVAKVNFNFLIVSAVEAMAEAFSVVEKSGLDPHAFYEMVASSAFSCPLYQNYGKILVDQSWDQVGFKLFLGLKDVRLAQETASAADARMPLTDLFERRFLSAIKAGLGEKDWTAVAVESRVDAGLIS